MLPVIGDQNFSLAIKEKKISNCEEINIRQALRYVMIKVGLRAQNWPAPTERQLLLNHVKNNFSNHTCGEIRLAFEMAIDGKLNVDPKCYENFSCLYFSEIMNAYREWAKEEFRLIESKTFKAEQKIYTEEEILNIRRGEIEQSFQAMKSGHYPTLHPYFLEVLMVDKFITEIKTEEIEGKVFELKKETLVEFFVKSLGTKEKLYEK